MLLKYICMHKIENTECYVLWRYVRQKEEQAAMEMGQSFCVVGCTAIALLNRMPPSMPAAACIESARGFIHTHMAGVMASSWHRGWIRFRKHLKSRQHSVSNVFRRRFSQSTFRREGEHTATDATGGNHRQVEALLRVCLGSGVV